MDTVDDPKEKLEILCRESKECQPFLQELIKCSKRVEGNAGTTETCVQELFDLSPCIDNCVIKIIKL